MIVAAALVCGVAGCQSLETTIPPVCGVEASLDPATAGPGDVVTLTGGPFTRSIDTQVLVDGVPASDIVVTRTDCAVCDELVETEGCDAFDAVACDSCVEVTTFVVPDVPSGTQPVVLINAWGSTEGLTLDVIGDTAVEDTDTGVPDTDTDVADTDTDVADTDTDVPVDTDTDVPVDTDTDVPVDTDTSDTDVPLRPAAGGVRGVCAIVALPWVCAGP